MNSVYTINKGINKPIEFKGLKAQYIWYLGGGLVVLLILFSILYLCSVNMYLCLFIIVALAALLFMKVYNMSNKYGEYGLLKKAAKKALPTYIKCNSKKVFQWLR
ncbi:hypothetical protein GALL_165730 [mine drainage metagenome]|uniref:DUF4133 domain-containing protein n=1 Tax=mine drainage metagenome TaxID=410659 RepID=A0A1J5SAR7_9ZZZZ